MNENNKVKKRDKFLAIGITVLAVIVLVGVGFAFFSASVSNTNRETVSTETATLSLKFADNDNGVSGTLNLGESIIKKFTLENTGTLDAYAKINWYNLVNTYMNGSLTYNLEQSESEDGIFTSIGSGNVPVSNAETTEMLKNGILVPVNTKYYYKLTITFNNLDVNQNSDISANFHSFFSLEEGKLTGADKIQNLAAGANTSSTDVITKAAPVGSTCTNTLAYDGTSDNNLRYVGANPCNYVTFNGESPKEPIGYQMYADGNISTNSPRFGYDGGQEYPDETTCQNAGLNGSFAYSGNDGTATCTLNTETNKYYIEAYGYLTSLGIYESKNDCETAYSNQGMQGSTIPSGLSCKSKGTFGGGWRIIGVMNNIDDGTGKKETRIKLIRNEALGNYSWDTSDRNVSYGAGLDDWTQADLMQELNGDYLDTTLTSNTVWYNGYNNKKTEEYNYIKGLKTKAQSQIGEAKWYLYGPPDPVLYNGTEEEGTAAKLYRYERGMEIIQQSSEESCNYGTCPRPTEWTGKVALMYPSDYEYAVGGKVRTSCLEKHLRNYQGTCGDNDWLKPLKGSSWCLSRLNNFIYSISCYGGGFLDSPDNSLTVLPVIYLKSDVSITDGNGSPESPYTLE